MTLHVYTQTRENYGTPDNPYWKFKGGRTVVITGIGDAELPAVLEYATMVVEVSNAMYEEYICGYGVQPNDAPTDDERDQLDYDGRITSPSDRIPYCYWD